MKIKSILDAKDISGKIVFLRADMNVPVKKGKIQDDFRIHSSLPTIEYLIKKNCKIIIATHLGRPGGKKKKEYSTKPIAIRLGKLLGKKVTHLNDCFGPKMEAQINRAKFGQVLCLENLRFYREEDSNDFKFAKELASMADIYVNDAFAVSHRENASVSAIKKFLPSYAGLLLAEEVKNLSQILRPKKPLIVIIGGAKIETKAPLVKKLHSQADKILIGGALANNFLKANNFEVGKSLVDDESIIFAKRFKNDHKILLPIDLITTKESLKKIAGGKNVKIEIKPVTKVDKADMIMDIGPETMRLYADYIKKAKSIIWNGPMGYFENERFKHGTLTVGRVVATVSRGRAFGVVGGGETIDALKMTKMEDDVDWVSTAGGAMLTFLGGGNMPGLAKIVK